MTKKPMITCHFCGETGHKANSCFKQGHMPTGIQDGNKIEIQAQDKQQLQVGMKG